ncbi:hypothetical protein CFP71_37510 [Amycolatopsis thailandensis]|uniref:Outer membrane channel protein CpnT-like N-terminal domain-containing protein n=1 Tax=Amycolatopsis thailandensis TaxID=589330 RepID=A0A229RH63_9PSEU|nr:hypothetical protein CFP71_37510 [Amycolatopsis thailandensis]
MHIPPDVRKFLEFTLGLSWPESDDQGLVALWKAWEAFEDAAGVFEAAARAAGVAVPQVLEGETGEFFAHFLGATIPDGVAGLGEAAGELAKMAQNAAADVYKTKVMFVVFAAFTLASIIHLMATLIGALFTGVVIAAARVALTAIWRALITRMGQLSLSGGLSQATKTALLKFAKDLAIKTGGFAAFGAALMGGTDFGVQARQIADGDRQGWDTRSLTSSFVGGALGGAFAGIFHSAAGGIRKTAFDLRDRLAIDPDHLDTLVKQTAGVTAQDIMATIDKPLAALGDAGYATGQFVTTVATAPLVNLALGAPVGNPALGALGALSKYGGGRTAPGTGAALDTIHPPEIPDLTIPTTEKPGPAEKPAVTEKPATASDSHSTKATPAPEKAELPPPYTAVGGGVDLRPEKTPAYTTSPQALGTLYTASTATTHSTGGGAVTTANGATTRASTSPVSAAPTQNGVRATPATVATGHAAALGSGTSVSPVLVPDTASPTVSPAVTAPETTTQAVHATSGESPAFTATPQIAQHSHPAAAIADPRAAETRPDLPGQTRSTGPETSRAPVDRAIVTSNTAANPASLPTTATRPDTTSTAQPAGHNRTAEPALSQGTRSFLTQSIPESAAVLDVAHSTAHTPDAAPSIATTVTDPIPSGPAHSITIASPLGPVRAIPLPENGGVAFVPSAYAANVASAFPEATPGLFRLVTQHRDGLFELPGEREQGIPHRPGQLVQALRQLPPALARWGTYTRLDLLACDLTTADYHHLAPTVRTTLGLELSFPHSGTPLYIPPDGTVTTTDPGTDNTLHLAPKHRRDGSTVAADPDAPETAERLAETARRIIQEHGALPARNLLALAPDDIFPAGRFESKLRQSFARELEIAKESGSLWRPIYRGRHNKDKGTPESLDDLSAWLYRMAITYPHELTTVTLRRAAEAGFSASDTQIRDAIKSAAVVAEGDGHRRPYLSLANPEHRARIELLVDRVVANRGYNDRKRYVAELGSLNVHGAKKQLSDLVAERERELKNDPALLAAAQARGLPDLRPSGLFMGRSLNADNHADHEIIDRAAYALIWERKTANVDELVTQLQREGIAGSAETLQRLVASAIDEATRNGDRLQPLSITDPDHHDAIQARLESIYQATPIFFDPDMSDRVKTVVKHMRLRHITGPQEELEAYADNAPEPAAFALPELSLATIDLTDPDAFNRQKLDHENPLHISLIRELAGKAIDTHGIISNETLALLLAKENVERKAGIFALIDAVKTDITAAGSSWYPNYRGRERQRAAQQSPDLTTLLWRLATDHPQESPVQLARRAEYVGFLGNEALVTTAHSTIAAMVDDQRRHPITAVSDPAEKPRLRALIAALSTDRPGLTTDALVSHLRDYNVHGSNEMFVAEVKAIREAGFSDADVAAGRELSTLRPDDRILGRHLDIANEADLLWIDKLAYATVWAHKADTTDQLVHRLEQDGITNTDDGLTPLVARIIEEATANGDRHETLSANLPDDHDAILHRTSALVLKNLDLFDLAPPDATTALVRHMRVNHITGTNAKLRDIATTILTVRTDQPLPGTHTIPIRTHDNTITHAIPLPRNGGVAFVESTYAPNVNAAFPQPQPGVINVLTRHDRHTDTYHLGGRTAYTPQDLVNTIAALPVTWNNTQGHTLNLWACYVTAEQHRHLDTLFRRNPALGHLTLTVAHYDTPLHITSDGAITTVDPHLGNTLHLAPKRKRGAGVAADPNAPETAAKLAMTANEILRRHGDIDGMNLRTFVPNEIFPDSVFEKDFRAHFSKERDKLKESGELWGPLYRGKRNDGKFGKESSDDLTVWLYRRVIAENLLTPSEIARRAQESGFSTPRSRLLTYVQEAIDAAVSDGRRHPELTLAKNRDQIIPLTDRLLANSNHHTPTEAAETLKNLNVRGATSSLELLVTQRQRALKDNPELLTTAQQHGPPTLPNTTLILGKTLDTDNPDHHDLIDKLAYTTAWEHKTATTDQLTDLLHHQGITSRNRDTLRGIVAKATDEAARNGDRLPLLATTDPAQHAAIHTRTTAILSASVRLYSLADPVKALVNHMRMRHITGPQQDLETMATRALHTPITELLHDTSLHPIDLEEHLPGTRAPGLDGEDAEAGSWRVTAAHTAAAERILLQFGNLEARYLTSAVHRKTLQGTLSEADLRKHLGTARTKLRESGELWNPLYRGVRNTGTFDRDNADDLTVWLYRRVIAEPSHSSLAIARSAVAAGFVSDHHRLERGIKEAIDAAVSDGRRHPELTLAKNRDQIIPLTDRLLANSNHHTPTEAAETLKNLNVRGATSDLELLVTQRQHALKNNPELLTTAQQHGPPTLPNTTLILGKTLDTDNPDHHDLIDKLAYTTAWEHKTATTDQLTDLLHHQGITGTYEGLRSLVARAADEATANGDRYVSLSADRHSDREAILYRTGTLALRNHTGLSALHAPDAITALVRHMRVNHITGTQEKLRDIATTVLAVRTDQPLPDTITIPVLTHDNTITHAIPLPHNSGYAFIDPAYTTNVTNAFTHPTPGTINILVRHNTVTDTYHLPHQPARTPADLITTITNLPVEWTTQHTLNLWACDLTATQHQHFTTLTLDNPTLNHLTLTPAYLDAPIHITPGGEITTTDPGIDNTLHLAPPRQSVVLPEALVLPTIVPDPQSLSAQLNTEFDAIARTGERTKNLGDNSPVRLPGEGAVGPAGVPALTLSFAETAATLTSIDRTAVRETAHAVAQAAALRAKWGLPGPAVTVTAYSGKGLTPGREAIAPQRRAEQVRSLLRAALAEELTASSLVRLEDIEVHAEVGTSTTNGVSDGRHHVVVETSVAAVRSTAENLTIKAYDSVTEGLPGLRMTRAELDGRLAEFSELSVGGRLEHQPLPPATRSQLIILDERTAALGDAELRNRVRAMVSDTLLAASLVPVRQQDLGSRSGSRGVSMDRRVIQPITPARLTQVLDELNTFIERGQDPTRTPASLLAGLTVSPGDHLAVRLASLGLVNMSASSRDAVTADPLYRALVRNPAALTEALFAGTGHEEQHFLNTCTPAAIHAAVRGRVPTIAGLLHLGRAVADATGRDLQRVDPAVRGRRDRPLGRTLEEMVRKRIADARAEFTSLEMAAMTLVSADQAAPATKRDWNALTDRWGRTMQKLAAADLRAVSVPVLTRKVVPGDWLTSLALTSPLVVDRGSRRLAGVDQSSYVARLQPHLGFEPDGTMFGANETVGHAPRTVLLGDELGTPESRTAFWEEVTAQGGTFLKTPNHWLHLRAAMEDDRPVFVVGDAKYGNLARQSPEQFARWADSSHARAHEKLFPHLVEETSSEVGDAVIADPPDSRHYELTDAHGRDYGIGFAGSVERGEVLVSAAAASTDHAERVVAVHSTQEDGTASRVESVQDWADFTDGDTTRPFHLIFESEDGKYVATDPTGEAAVRIEPEAMAEKVFSVASFRRAAGGAVRPPLIIATHETRPGGADPALNRRFLARLSELTGPWHAFEHSGKLTFERDFGVVGIDHGGTFSEISPSVSDLHFLAKDSVFAISSRSGNAASRAEMFTETTPPLQGPWGDREPIHVFLDGDPRHALVRVSGSQDIALGGRAIGRLLASNAEFRKQLALRPGRPVVVHSTDSGSRNDIGGLGFDLAGSLHEAGLYPPVYGIKGEPGDEARYAAVSRLRTGDLLTTDLHRPDGTLAVRLVRTPGDESVLRRLQHWTSNSTRETLSTYVHRDGGSHRAPWDGAPVLIVAPRAPRGYLATRRDGKAGVVSPVALADVLRDDPALRQGLGADPDLSYLLVGWGGRTVGLASFAAGMARGGYARSAYAPRGALTFRPGGRLGLTGPGFRVAEPRTPRPKDIVNFESANERLGTFGQFFPSKDFDSAAEALAALGESRGQQQYYIREVSRPDGRGGVDRVPLPYRAPWAGRDPWFTSGHGSPAGLQFALATGNPYRRGDVVSLSGAPAARAIFASEIYRRAQPDPNAGVVLGQCSANLIGTGRTVAYGIREAWGSEAVPTTVWGASEVVAVDWNGERTVKSGGAFFEAVAPGTVPSPPRPLFDGLGGFEPDDAEAGLSIPSDAVTLPRPGGIRIRLDPTFEGFSDDDASSATGDALFEQDDAESDAPPESPVPSVIEDEPASAEFTAMVEWSERIGAAHDRMTERGEIDPEAVSRVRDRAESLVGEPPDVDGADEEIHAFLHEGLVTLLTDALLGGASLREAWQHADVTGLRQTLASLREHVPDAPYADAGDEAGMASSAAEASGPQSGTEWAGPLRETRDWLSARAGRPEVEAGLSRARRLARSMPHAAPGADEAARHLLHDGLVMMLAEAMARGASPREAWEAPVVARLRQDAEAARGTVRGAPHYTALPSQELSELRTESAPSPEVRPSDAVPAEQAVPEITSTAEPAEGTATEPGPRTDPPRLRELIEEFTWQLPEAAALPDPVLRDQAERLLGERPLPEPGYGPVSARQRELWHSAVEAVAGELARGGDGRKPAESVRARFERLRAYDALTQWAEETLARYTDDFAEAEAELRLEAEQDQPSAERVLLARRQAEAMLGATAPGVPGGVAPRIRQEFHNGLLASLSRYIANGNEPEASWNYLEEARLAAEDVRLTSRYLWGRTGFGVFTAETGTGYLRDSHEEPPPPYSFEEPDLRFHREMPPSYDDVVDLDHTAVDHGSLAQAADHLIRLFELARDLPGNVLSPWRARMLRHLLPPTGLPLDQLDSRLPVHNVLLTALAYQAYLDRDRQDGTGDTPYLLKLDPGDLAASLSPVLAHDQVRDDAYQTLRDAFEAAKYYSES